MNSPAFLAISQIRKRHAASKKIAFGCDWLLYTYHCYALWRKPKEKKDERTPHWVDVLHFFHFSRLCVETFIKRLFCNEQLVKNLKAAVFSTYAALWLYPLTDLVWISIPIIVRELAIFLSEFESRIFIFVSGKMLIRDAAQIARRTDGQPNRRTCLGVFSIWHRSIKCRLYEDFETSIWVLKTFG